ncbi:MAG: ATP-binding protein, partial [Candidatus Eisenbacteria bacterium]
VLTGVDDLEISHIALSHGAQDYLVKGRVNSDLLAHCLWYAMERQALQAQLEDSRREQMELKDRFLSLVSHELRSPLSAIHILVSNLHDGLSGEVNDAQRESLATVLRNANRLRDLIGELMDVTRTQTGKLSIERLRTELPVIIDETVNSLKSSADREGITIKCLLPHDLPPVHADPRRVKEILVNLVENGIKFTPDGGSVTVSAGVFDEDAGSVRIVVSDTGCGIDAEDQEKIFDYLSQAEGPPAHGGHGLGLGLYLCREFVSRNGGRIWVASGPGRGSTFSFTLPIYSLRRMLDPILTSKNLQRGSVAVIVATLSEDDQPEDPEAFARGIRETRRVLEGCTLCDVDVILPAGSKADEGRTIQIVACANEPGVTILTDRIRGAIATSVALRDCGIHVDVAWFAIDTSQILWGRSFEQAKEKIVCEVERLIFDSAVRGEVTE